MGAQHREFNEGNIDTVALAHENPLGMAVVPTCLRQIRFHVQQRR
jgi:hypothetical protein